MFRRISFLFLFLLVIRASVSVAISVPDTANHMPPQNQLRISLITCGVGEEIWETFGHTAVRVTDSAAGTDNVYNYGTFNGYEQGFELKFMQGKLLYYVSFYPYSEFVQEYQAAHRKMEEQVLLLNPEQKNQIYDFLKWNALPVNREYKYDFFFDNCSTRIRDIFPKTLGTGFHFGTTLPAGAKITYRDIINRYLYRVHFERVGINILLGSKIDKVMSNEDIMFLPDYLRDGIGGANLNGQPIATKPAMVLEGQENLPAGTNWMLIITIACLVLTAAGLFIPSMKWLGDTMSILLLVITGLLGCLILVMWFGTDHQACQDNFNILWALPTNLLLVFTYKKNRSRYALAAIMLLFISLVLNITGVQRLPLIEMGPLLLSLLCVYGTIYKRSKVING
ncbi:Lnb N-terminal periplasmic domain-containing protein [Chitinophagaceae bacterium MMS25-I14]